MFKKSDTEKLQRRFHFLASDAGGFLDLVSKLPKMIEEYESGEYSDYGLGVMAVIGHPSLPFMEMYAEFGEARFIASRLSDAKRNTSLDGFASSHLELKSRFVGRLDDILLRGAKDLVAEYERWLGAFEDVTRENLEYPALEIEFDRRLLHYRDFIEYSRLGMIELGASGAAVSILAGGEEMDPRLRSIIVGYCPQLFTEFQDYAVLVPWEFPEHFWWRRLVWSLSPAQASGAKGDAGEKSSIR